MWPKALVWIHFTLLENAPEEICLPHCTYVPLNLYYSLHTDHILLLISSQKSMLCNIYLLYYCKICAKNKYAPQMPYTSPIQDWLIGISGGCMPICVLDMNSLTSNMWPGALHTDANDDINDNATAWLHIMSRPPGQISQKLRSEVSIGMLPLVFVCVILYSFSIDSNITYLKTHKKSKYSGIYKVSKSLYIFPTVLNMVVMI